MQSLIAIAVAVLLVYSFVWAKNCGYSFIAFLRILVKRLALYVMSFSWIIVLATVLMLACYSNISGLIKDLLSANSVESIKGIVRFIFGVDSAFIALQMLALYSLIASFISCLALSFGVAFRFVYRMALRVVRVTSADAGQAFVCCGHHTMPTFKLFLKYNS